MKWINVNDALPSPAPCEGSQESQYVLTFSKDDGFGILYYSYATNCWENGCWSDEGYHWPRTITHWGELISPVQEEKQK